MTEDDKLKQLAAAAAARRAQQSEAAAKAQMADDKRRQEQSTILGRWRSVWMPALNEAVKQVNVALGDRADDRLRIVADEMHKLSAAPPVGEGNQLAMVGIVYERDGHQGSQMIFELKAPVSIRVATLEVYVGGHSGPVETLHLDDQLAAAFFRDRLTGFTMRHQSAA